MTDARAAGRFALLRKLREAALGHERGAAGRAAGGRGLVPRAEPGRRREREHAGGAPPGVAAVGRRPRRRPRRHRGRPGRRLQRAEPADRQPRRAADARQLLRGDRRRAAGARQAIAGAVDPLFDDTERNPGQAENVDVAATVTRLLGERAPAESAGRFLAEAFEPSLLPAADAAARAGGAACAASAGFRSVSVRPRGRGLRFGFRRRGSRGVTVDVFQSSIGRRVLGNRRIARFTGRRKAFTWRGRRRAERAAVRAAARGGAGRARGRPPGRAGAPRRALPPAARVLPPRIVRRDHLVQARAARVRRAHEPRRRRDVPPRRDLAREPAVAARQARDPPPRADARPPGRASAPGPDRVGGAAAGRLPGAAARAPRRPEDRREADREATDCARALAP